MKDQIDERNIQRIQIMLKSYIPGAFRQLSQLKGGRSTKEATVDKVSQRFGQHLKQTVISMAIELNIHGLDFETNAKKSANHVLKPGDQAPSTPGYEGLTLL